MVSRYHPPPAFRSLDSEAVSYAHGGLCDLSHCTPPIRPALSRKFTSSGPEGPTTMLKIIVLGLPQPPYTPITPSTPSTVPSVEVTSPVNEERPMTTARSHHRRRASVYETRSVFGPIVIGPPPVAYSYVGYGYPCAWQRSWDGYWFRTSPCSW
jgi:hypothetical protein